MRYAQIRKYDTANGLGIRTSIFFTGCTFNCKGCFNKLYQDFNYGEIFDNKAMELLIEYLNDENVAGLTILGGEPLQQDPKEMKNFLRYVRHKLRDNQNIWIYSGNTFEKILENRILLDLIKECDVLVDGLFEQDKKNLRLKFRGSSNQRVIDIKKSLEKKEAILYLD